VFAKEKKRREDALCTIEKKNETETGMFNKQKMKSEGRHIGGMAT